MIYVKKNEKYVGEFKNGKKHGNGQYFYSNGHKYEGKFNQGQIQDS